MSETLVNQLPSPEDFFLNVPLYNLYPFDDEGTMRLYDLENFEGTIDAYCSECLNQSIFARALKSKANFSHMTYDRLFSVGLQCTRNTDHKLFFLFKVMKMSVQKIGQYPSIADLNLHDVKKYEGLLGVERLREFKRATGLAAHGIGVGSFVYLRRIFESLIEEAHHAAGNEQSWDETEYQKSRMSERIDLLKKYLPQFLVNNRSVYGILSKGIHELTENECLRIFPVVKAGIEIILDAKLEEKRKAQKLKVAEQDIQALLGASTSDT
jgi:hypothetical protein